MAVSPPPPFGLLPRAKISAACSNEYFLWRRDYALEEKGFDLANVIFALVFTLRGG